MHLVYSIFKMMTDHIKQYTDMKKIMNISIVFMKYNTSTYVLDIDRITGKMNNCIYQITLHDFFCTLAQIIKNFSQLNTNYQLDRKKCFIARFNTIFGTKTNHQCIVFLTAFVLF